MIMTCMTALAAINSSSPFELKSDRLLRRDLQQFQHPQGGLNSNKLSQSKTKAHVHKALLTCLQSDSEMFQSALLSSNTKISSAVLDSGASFTSITKENLLGGGSADGGEDAHLPAGTPPPMLTGT